MTGRLTPQERADRRLSGAELQRLVTDVAALFGWQWVHFRPARTARGWRTPVEGPLGQGWPDLMLAKPGRLLAVEIKRELSDPVTCDQSRVHDVLRAAGLEVHVWRPSDLTSGVVQAALR